MSSRNLNDLNQSTKEMAIRHAALCEAKGVSLLIYCTLRSNEEQTELYSYGRTKSGDIKTNARAGESAHNPDKLRGKSSAYDCCPMVSGKPVWSSTDPLWAIVGKCGEEVGLDWAGRWTGKLKEKCHFQDPYWRKP